MYFNVPVDAEALGIPEYRTIIQVGPVPRPTYMLQPAGEACPRGQRGSSPVRKEGCGEHRGPCLCGGVVEGCRERAVMLLWSSSRRAGVMERAWAAGCTWGCSLSVSGVGCSGAAECVPRVHLGLSQLHVSGPSRP